MMFEFIGFTGEVYYGEGKFTVGNVYEATEFSDYDGNLPADALFIDDEGHYLYEELQYFKQVNDDDK